MSVAHPPGGRPALHPDWIVPDWPVPAGVRAFMTTRAGGTSAGPWGVPPGATGGLNLGRTAGDAAEAVEANRARLRQHLPGEPAWLHQVHGAAVVDADAPGTGDGPPQADASVSLQARVVCAVQTADCLPLLLADERGRAVGAVHAGWRGLAAGVIQNAARRMRARLQDPHARLLAWFGPAIGPGAFEVGPDVLAAMSASLPDAAREFTARPGGKYGADLYGLARQALAQAGVSDVWGGGLCTHRDPARFYSYRRDRVTGRHAALIWIE
jgi:hypothetical protein